MNQPSAPITLGAYNDPWSLALQRWWDIGSYRSESDGRLYFNKYRAWSANGASNGAFDYAARAAGVTLTYDKAPGRPTFVAHISAKKLKPNFAYQLKLAGKPQFGPRGTGQRASYVSASSKLPDATPILHPVLNSAGLPKPVNGDDWTNQQLGYAGRWWNDSNPSGNTNAVTDAAFQANTTDTIYGYIFLGDFVTDEWGNAETDISATQSYHITYQQWQSSSGVLFGTFPLRGALKTSAPAFYYGYGSSAPSMGDVPNQEAGLTSTTLYYQLEPGRPNPIVLASGTYHCRLLITEETFHNVPGTTSENLGGRWKTVMATEDFAADGTPDNNSQNDIVFTIPTS